jgi:DNA-nicking Smr family endonuclease
VIDVAHSGEDREDAIRKVIKGIEISLSGNHKGIKVIHGRGSKSGHTAVIKNHVIHLLHKEARRLNARLVKDKDNPGAHIMYFD